MEPRELFYRGHQSVLKVLDKLSSGNASTRLIKLYNEENPLYVEKIIRESCLNNIEDETLSNIIGDLSEIQKEADDIVENRYNIFGKETYYGSPINFHLDPITNLSWPLKFWDDIEYRKKNQYGGIKFAWEINRLHHWPKLAIAYRIVRDEKYLQEILHQLDHWQLENPFRYGINWISGIELGIRMVNIYFTLKILEKSNFEYTKKVKKNILDFVYSHGTQLYRYPSKYSSAANHALAESLGLFICGAKFPELKASQKWRKNGLEIFEREIQRQIYPDGSSFEHSIPYLQFVIDHALVFCMVAKEQHIAINQSIESRIEKACNFIAHIVDERGNVPMIGDDDDGYLIKLWFGEHNNFLSILNYGGVKYNNAHFIHPESSLDLKTGYACDKQEFGRWDKLSTKTQWRKQSKYFNNAGLGVIVDQTADREILFVGNSGPLGLEPLSGHGHADALSFWLSINGQPFFVDPGTYLYHGSEEWRRYFRSTSAHNTVVVDNLDQAEQLTDFIFGKFYKVNNILWEEEKDRVIWGGKHDGYERLNDPVTHIRKISFYKNEKCFHLTDKLACLSRHDIKVLFHLHPRIMIQQSGNHQYCLENGDTRVILKADSRFSGNIFKGNKSPLFGWYSSGFNKLEKTNTIVFSCKIDGNTTFKSEVKIT